MCTDPVALSGTGLTTYGASCGPSSRRFKHDIETYTGGLAAVMKMRPVSFIANGEKTPELGEEIHDIDRRLVTFEADGKTPHGLMYDRFSATLASAVQELKAANDNLVSESAALRAQLTAANDNHVKDAATIEELRKELHDLKNGVGFKRAVGQ